MNRIAASVFCSIVMIAFCAFSLAIGDRAPAFTLTTTADSVVSLAQYGDRICVLYFFCSACDNQRATGSAVEKFVWQQYKSQNVKVLGIETSDHSKGEAIATAKKWDITFPVALYGDNTRSAYGIGGNTALLIDKQGVVRAFVAAPTTLDTTDEKIDSLVSSFAERILPLSATVITLHQKTARYADALYNVKWTSDLQGRRIEKTEAVTAPQRVIDGTRSVRTVMRNR